MAFITIVCVSLFLQCGIALNVRPLDFPTPSPDKDAGLDPDEYWDLIKETVEPPDAPRPSVKDAHEWFRGKIPPMGFAYVYGGKTAYRVMQGTSKEFSGILACYLDGKEYSGVTIALGDHQSVDLTALREAKAAGIAFWAKGGIGTESVIWA